MLQALEEFDRLGRDAFLLKYGFGRARSYFLVMNGRSYDSKPVAGAAHGYQHPGLGPLRASDFSGGDATVRSRLESLGFEVVVTEPSSGPTRALVLFEDYSRREVHDIFAPETSFTPGAGLWGLSGIVEVDTRDFVLFVSYGREQGEHRFDEGVTAAGVVTWQSQPQQALEDAQVRKLIEHDSDRHNVRLFLRTKAKDASGGPMPYTYLGRLAYLTHDADRERPVYFQWQIVDRWPPPENVLARMTLPLLGTDDAVAAPPPPTQADGLLVESAPPPPPTRTGRRTTEFQGRKSPDRSQQDARNRALGEAGERAVVVSEKRRLTDNGREDLAEAVRHVSVIEGDGAGYDVLSFELDGSKRHIEVKTTRGMAATSFYVSPNEVEFSKQHAASYWLYRLYEFDPTVGAGAYWARRGSLVDGVGLRLDASQFIVNVV